MLFLVRFQSAFQFLFMSDLLETDKNKSDKKNQEEEINLKACMLIYDPELQLIICEHDMKKILWLMHN